MVAPVAYGDISQQEADMIGAAASWLPDYVRTASNFRQLCRDSVVAGSPAQELIGLGFETGDGQAALRGIVADDYLMGTCQLLSATTGLTNFTLYAAIRGAFESDAMICWLLEPGLSALLRAARMFVLRLRLQKQNEKFAPFKAFASERRAVIHEQAAELGLSVKAETVAGEQLPTMTALVKQLLPDLGDETQVELGGLLFHNLSGMTHGEDWGSLLGQKATAAGHGTETIKVDLNIRNFLLAFIHVLELHERAVCCYGTQFGVQTSARPAIIAAPWVGDVGRLYSEDLPA